MEKRLLGVYLGLISVIFVGVFVHAPLTVWLGTLFPDYDLMIKAWKELLMLVAGGIMCYLLTARGLWAKAWQDWAIRLSVLFVVLHIVMLLWQPQGLEPMVAGLMINLRFIAFFVLVYVATLLVPAYKRRLLALFAVGAGLVIVFGIVQLFLPPDFLKIIGYGPDTIASYLTVDDDMNYIRISSTLRGPNPLGALMVMALAGVSGYGLWRVFHRKGQPLWWLALAALTGVGAAVVLWHSYSRSAALAAIIAVGIVTVVLLMKHAPKTLLALCGIGAVLLGVGWALLHDTEFVSHVILHDDPDGGAEVTSNQAHVESLSEGTNRLLAQPLGAGVGSTGSASLLGDNPLIIENQYLFVAHEVGWAGLVLFAVLYGLVLGRLWQAREAWPALALFASGVGLGIIGLLLPVWVDDTISVVWWGLAGALLTGVKYERSATDQKAKRTT